MDEPRFLVGQLLLAMPGMGDPRFDKAVIAMCSHDESGALGIGLGRLVPRIGFHTLLEQLDIPVGVAPDAPIHLGGPVEPQRGFILHSRDWGGEGSIDVADRWVLSGTKTCVPAGLYADRLVVSAATDDGPRLFLVDAADVQRERQDPISYAPEALGVLDGAAGSPVGDASSLADVLQVGTAATCAVLCGMAEQSVKLTAAYTKTRQQFGQPIAMFQAVGQRAADSYIDTRTIRLTMLQAVWLLQHRRPAAKEVAVAKYFASDAGQRVVRAATHLHGGMGVSREYPLHRFYVGVKQLELTLGGGTRQLVALGRMLAEEPVSA